MPQASMTRLWKSRSPQLYWDDPGLPEVSTLPMCVTPLTRLLVKVGRAERASMPCANISTHLEWGSVKSGDREPYHETSTRPWAPAASDGITLERNGPESTRTGLLQCRPRSVEWMR